MNRLSVRFRITLWFFVVLFVIVGVTYAVIFSVSDSVMQKTVRDSLVETVEDNADEIEYFARISDANYDGDGDQYIVYKGGYIEIDDDFLDSLNGISTALYHEESGLLYGDAPLSRQLGDNEFYNGIVRTVMVGSTPWYVFDRRLEGTRLEGLWLRGAVSSERGTSQLTSIVRVSLIGLPILLLLALAGGYAVAGRALRPIKRITETAEQISQGSDLKKRIGLGEGSDELHRLADAFDDMFRRLEESFEAERRFTSDASHELRTPMAVIMSQCEDSLAEDKSPEEYRDALRLIRRQGGRMTRMISDMLAFTRLERRTERPELYPVSLSELAETVCADMEPIAEKDIELLREIEPGVTVQGDRALLTRLLSNLISNAYRYGRQDGHIWVSLKDGDRAQLTVADDGRGIAEKDRENVFRRFWQADGARSGDGAGLGLAMVREIARLHGGDVSVAGRPGGGSVFTCTLEKSLTK